MKFRWDPKKNEILKAGERSVSFEEIAKAMENGGILDDYEHPNRDRYPNQHISEVAFRGYVWQVPYVVEADGTRFLKTAFPSRVANKKHGGA